MTDMAHSSLILNMVELRFAYYQLLRQEVIDSTHHWQLSLVTMQTVDMENLSIQGNSH